MIKNVAGVFGGAVVGGVATAGISDSQRLVVLGAALFFPLVVHELVGTQDSDTEAVMNGGAMGVAVSQVVPLFLHWRGMGA